MTHIGTDGLGQRFDLPGGDGRSVTISWAALSDVGRRRAANEDSVVTVAPVFAVADGMGGHAAGDRASAAAVEHLEPRPGTVFTDLATITEALAGAADDIDTLAIGVPMGVGTTVTGAALVIDEGEPAFAVFNIGDSRVYQFARNDLRRVTIDHSVVQQLVDAGIISADDAEDHPDSNVITRALGFRDDPTPDSWILPLRSGMRLLICSDGLTKELGDGRLRLHMAAGMSAAETASALVDAALASGGRDNVTVVIVDVLDAPPNPGENLSAPE